MPAGLRPERRQGTLRGQTEQCAAEHSCGHVHPEIPQMTLQTDLSVQDPLATFQANSPPSKTTPLPTFQVDLSVQDDLPATFQVDFSANTAFL